MTTQTRRRISDTDSPFRLPLLLSIFIGIALPFLYCMGTATMHSIQGKSDDWMWGMGGMLYLASIGAIYAVYQLINVALNDC